MTPKPKNEAVRARMKRTPQRDTPVEVAIRREAYRRGLRYRVDRRPTKSVRSRADMVFIGPKVAVYIDGCFWHGCPKHGTWPKNNAQWWREKLEANMARDRRVDAALEGEGWRVVRIWEHEDVVEAVDCIEDAIRSRAT